MYSTLTSKKVIDSIVALVDIPKIGGKENAYHITISSMDHCGWVQLHYIKHNSINKEL